MLNLKAKYISASVLSLTFCLLSGASFAQSSFQGASVDSLGALCQRGDINSCLQGIELWENDEVDNISYVDFADKACDLGDADSCYSLAFAYDPDEGDEGFEPDLGKFLYYLDKSCTLGDYPDCENLSEIYSDGDIVERNTLLAQNYKDKSLYAKVKSNAENKSKCEAGDAVACWDAGDSLRAFEIADTKCTIFEPQSDSADHCNLLGRMANTRARVAVAKNLGAQTTLLELNASLLYFDKACEISSVSCQWENLRDLQSALKDSDRFKSGYYTMTDYQPNGKSWREIANEHCITLPQLTSLNNKWIDVAKNPPVGTIEVPENACDILKIDRDVLNVEVSDRDAQPLFRIPPIMPPRAEKSGHCKVKFDVSPEGKPFNVIATYCTETWFRRSSIRSVEKWRYNPEIVEGVAVQRKGLETKVNFQLADEYGNIIPE